MVQLKELFMENRFPTGWKLLLIFVYLPIGIPLAILRLFIGIHAILAALLLPKAPLVRSFVLRTMYAVLGIIVQEENIEQKEESAKVIISNHVSIFDHLAIHLLTGSISLNKWELPYCFHHALNIKDFGKLKEKDVLVSNIKVHMNKEISPIDIQPEGETTSGTKALLRFATWPFKLGYTIQPVSIRIQRLPVVDIAPSVISASWSSDFFWFLFVPVTVFIIRYLPKVDQNENETEDELTRRVEKMIADDLKISTSNHTSADKAEYVKRLLTIEQRRQSTRANYSYNDPFICEMTNRVKEILPHVPINTIRSDLVKTRNVDLTVSNFLEGLVRFTPETVNTVQPVSSISNKTSLEVSPSSSTTNSPKVFPKSAQDRMLSFQERKALLIETARKRYIEKHALNVVNS